MKTLKRPMQETNKLRLCSRLLGTPRDMEMIVMSWYRPLEICRSVLAISQDRNFRLHGNFGVSSICGNVQNHHQALSLAPAKRP